MKDKAKYQASQTEQTDFFQQSPDLFTIRNQITDFKDFNLDCIQHRQEIKCTGGTDLNTKEGNATTRTLSLCLGRDVTFRSHQPGIMTQVNNKMLAVLLGESVHNTMVALREKASTADLVRD